jgi:hypothetical protein
MDHADVLPPAPDPPSIFMNNIRGHNRFVDQQRKSFLNETHRTTIVLVLSEEFYSWAGIKQNQSGAYVCPVDIPAGYIMSSEYPDHSADLLVGLCAREGYAITSKKAKGFLPYVESERRVLNPAYNPREAARIQKTENYRLRYLDTDITFFPTPAAADPAARTKSGGSGGSGGSGSGGNKGKGVVKAATHEAKDAKDPNKKKKHQDKERKRTGDGTGAAPSSNSNRHGDERKSSKKKR